MGILKDLFIGFGSIEDFLCDTCHDVLDDPIGLDPCEHTFCKSCIIGSVTWVQPECPVQGCGQQFTGQRKSSRAYLSLLSKLEVRCPFRVAIFKGCTWNGKLGDLADHQAACEYNSNNPTHRCIERCGAKLVKGKEQDGQDHECAKYLKDELDKTRLVLLRKSELELLEREATEDKLKTLEEKLHKTKDKLKRKRKRVSELDPNSWSSSSSSSSGDSEDDEEESSGSSSIASPKLPKPILTRRGIGGKGGPPAKRGGMAPRGQQEGGDGHGRLSPDINSLGYNYN